MLYSSVSPSASFALNTYPAPPAWSPNPALAQPLPTATVRPLPMQAVSSQPVAASLLSSAMTATSFNTPTPSPVAGNVLLNNPELTQTAQANAEALQTESEKSKRTPGLKAFDTLLYPLLTNFGVFALSVLFTYLSTYGKPGSFFMNRGNWTRGRFQAIGFDQSSARSAAMLTWSFMDGCLAAPMVKLFEDRRGQISKFFDKVMGTTPKDPSVYDKEPKQSWKTVLGGRFVASMSIVPVWNLMEQKWGGKHKLNERLFDIPGEKLAKKMLTSWPVVTKMISKVIPADKLPKMMGVVLFESVYTAVTTAALYFASRAFASHGKDKQEQSTPKVEAPPAWPVMLPMSATQSASFGMG